MDFLDPKKNRSHQIRLMVGYVLMAIVVVLATTVLLYQAYGFGVKNGKVIQNGLVFVSSTPNPASIYMNGKLRGETNTRLLLEAGSYTMKLVREGYRDWQRAVTIGGGELERIGYPFLVPTSLVTNTLNAYTGKPAVEAQSPDRRWLLVAQPGTVSKFDVYDLKDPKKLAQNKTQITLPDNVLTAATGAQTLEVTEWSNDNQHVLLQHTYSAGKFEYIMLDRKEPAKSVNVTAKLSLAPTMRITLQDKKYDRYFVHNTADQSLGTATLEKPAVQPVLKDVLSYKTYGAATILYATAKDAAKGRTTITLHMDGTSYTLQAVSSASTYVLDISRYGGSWHTVFGSPADGRVYVYKDPVTVLNSKRALVPESVLKVQGATRVSFSANSQFVAAEHGSTFAVYDIENDRSYTYSIDQTLDKPQPYAKWMDSERLQLVSGGKVYIFDYDGTNVQELVPGLPAYTPYFDTGYKYVYALANPTAEALKATPTAKALLTMTSLRTAADQ